MKKENFIKRCQECRDGFLSNQEIENAVNQLYYLDAISEDGSEDNFDVYAVMGVLFQKCADYSLQGATSENTIRKQRARAKSFCRFIGGRVANKR